MALCLVVSSGDQDLSLFTTLSVFILKTPSLTRIVTFNIFFFPDVCNVDLSIYEPHVIAYLIKRYLRELPDPVISESFYERFIEATRIDNDDQCAKCIAQMVKELSPHHFHTLQ